MEVNSKTYWDYRFQTDWIKNFGQQQSAFFASIALGGFPQWLDQEIRSKKLSILDWGCALGDGTKVLKTTYPENAITGIDFSDIAIQHAKSTFTEIQFSAEDILKSTHKHKYDIVFTSNTLEHFDAPWRTLLDLSKYSKKHLVVLVPYKEYKRYNEHEYTFDEKNIPAGISDSYSLTWMEIIDGGSFTPSFWGELQVLLVYTHEKTISENNLRVIDRSEIRTIEAIYQQKEILKSVNQTKDHIVEQLKVSMASQQSEIEIFKNQLAEKDIAIKTLQASLIEAGAQLGANRVEERLLAEKNATIEALRNELTESNIRLQRLAEIESQIDTGNKLVKDLKEELEVSRLDSDTVKNQLQIISDNNAEINQLKSQVSDLQLQLESRKGLEQKLEEKQATIEGLVQELHETHDQIMAAHHKDLQNVQSQMESRHQDELRNVVTIYEKKIQESKESIDFLKQELNTAKLELSSKRKLEKDLEEKEVQFDRLKKQFTEIQFQLNNKKTLENELAGRTRIIETLKSQLDKANIEVGIKVLTEEQLAERESQVEKLKADISVHEKAREEMMQTITKLHTYSSQLQQDIEWYKRTFEERSLLGVVKDKIRKQRQ